MENLHILPVTDDPDTAGLWHAAAEGRIAVKLCSECRRVLHPPRGHCSDCGSWRVEWADASTAGRLYASTIVEHQVHPAFPTPYTIFLIDVDKPHGLRLCGRANGRIHLAVGQIMEAWFEPLENGVAIPQWRPVAP